MYLCPLGMYVIVGFPFKTIKKMGEVTLSDVTVTWVMTSCWNEAISFGQPSLVSMLELNSKALWNKIDLQSPILSHA